MSGTIVLRVPRETHAAVREAAAAAGVSMNSWISAVIDRQLHTTPIWALPPTNVPDGADRFFENAEQQAVAVEVVEDFYPAIVLAAAEPSPAA